jgi:hypothetical protein
MRRHAMDALRQSLQPDRRTASSGLDPPRLSSKVVELLGGIRGCTHVTELAGMLATAAFQTMAGQGLQDPDRKPFHIDRCHALDATKAVVGRYYPRWYKGTEPVVAADEADNH